MPHYRIQVISSDDAIASPDPEGITLDGIGQARALAVETLMTCARTPVPAGRVRTIVVEVCDERDTVAYRDALTLHGLAPDEATAGVWRAMAVMNG